MTSLWKPSILTPRVLISGNFRIPESYAIFSVFRQSDHIFRFSSRILLVFASCKWHLVKEVSSYSKFTSFKQWRLITIHAIEFLLVLICLIDSRPLLREISSFCLTKFWFPRTISSIDFFSVIDCKQSPLTVEFASLVLEKLGNRHRLQHRMGILF